MPPDFFFGYAPAVVSAELSAIRVEADFDEAVRLAVELFVVRLFDQLEKRCTSDGLDVASVCTGSGFGVWRFAWSVLAAINSSTSIALWPEGSGRNGLGNVDSKAVCFLAELISVDAASIACAIETTSGSSTETSAG